MAEMDPCSVHSLVTDPPYGPEFSVEELDEARDDLTHRHSQFSRSGAGLPRYGSWMPTSSEASAAKMLKARVELQKWHEEWLRHGYRVLRPGGWLLAFAAPPVYHRLAVAAEDTGFEIRGMVTWLCGQGWPKSKASLRPSIEPILLARKPFSEYGISANVERWGVGDIDHAFAKAEIGRTAADALISDEIAHELGDKRAYFYAPKVSKAERAGSSHPTQKPVQVFKYIYSLVARRGQVVLDPFCGSGSSGVAAAQLGLHWIGHELNPAYVVETQARLSLQEQKGLDRG